MEAIFIIGTGRSGTHFTCRSLAGFKNIFDPLQGKEHGQHLSRIARAAIHHQHYPAKASKYYLCIKNNLGMNQIFVDQHHPNLFFTDTLTDIFPHLIFLYPDRPIHQIVSSMLKHSGVLTWYEYAKKYEHNRIFRKKPVPFFNQFLGIYESSTLHSYKLHQLCALRVIAHKNRAVLLKRRGQDVRFINYENLIMDQRKEFFSAFTPNELAKLGEFNVAERSQSRSLQKYKEVLSQQQILDIKNIEKTFAIY
ncbi:MAG: hypothetical protein ACON5C_02985 [Alphaproteobacteria bacterium]